MINPMTNGEDLIGVGNGLATPHPPAHLRGGAIAKGTGPRQHLPHQPRVHLSVEHRGRNRHCGVVRRVQLVVELLVPGRADGGDGILLARQPCYVNEAESVRAWEDRLLRESAELVVCSQHSFLLCSRNIYGIDFQMLMA